MPRERFASVTVTAEHVPAERSAHGLRSSSGTDEANEAMARFEDLHLESSGYAGHQYAGLARCRRGHLPLAYRRFEEQDEVGAVMATEQAGAALHAIGGSASKERSIDCGPLATQVEGDLAHPGEHGAALVAQDPGRLEAVVGGRSKAWARNCSAEAAERAAVGGRRAGERSEGHGG